MSSQARLLCVALMALAGLMASAAMAADSAYAGFGIGVFEAGTCVNDACTYGSVERDPGEAFTQAAGHPPWGITSFELNHHSGLLGSQPEGAPLKRVRVDVPSGLAADPEALPQCARSSFDAGGCSSSTKVGTTEMEVYVDGANLTISGNVYDLTPEAGLPLLFGIEINPASPIIVPVRLFLEGHVAWSSDYHEYFEINNVPPETELIGGLKTALDVLKSKLNFDGQAGEGNFLTLPSVCSTTTESHLEVESWAGEVARTPTQTPVGVEGCATVPFSPSASILAGAPTYDEPDGASVIVRVPQNVSAHAINDADVREAHVALPEGLTLNPSAARGLGVCSPAQIGIGTANPVSCPAASRIGTVAIETDLPPHSLAGAVYLGDPGGGPITGPPFTIYLDAESIYGVSVRLRGLVNANPSTGELEASFTENPPLPFSELIVSMNGGPLAPLANPLSCGAAPANSLFTPFTGLAAWHSAAPFAGSGCPASIPFTWGQSTSDSSAGAGAFGSTAYTLQLARQDGQQYLANTTVELPPGLVGAIPSVPLCGEPQAAQGSCPASSRIGTATVSVGAGSEPYPFSGPVFLTGPFGGAPFGLSIPVAAIAGPFDFGTVVTRAEVGIEPYSGRVLVSSSLPTIVAGVPLRLKTLSVTVDRHDFLYNPTSCGALATESTLTSTFGATQGTSSTIPIGNCGALAFTPSFAASTSAKTSKAGGASLQVSITQGAHQSNIRSVVTQLPSVLSVRDPTLQLACLQATFSANPHSCPEGSAVGSATVTTPVLPGTLHGPAILVSHGGAAFPDLDIVLEGDGVRVILVGNTKITHSSITTTTFASLPDVPIESFSLTLPTGPHSLLSSIAKLCAHPLTLPTTIVSQSGVQLQRMTPIAVKECAGSGGEGIASGHRLFRILSTKRVGNNLLVKVRAFVRGRLSAGGRHLKGASQKLRKPKTVTLKLAITRTGLAALHAHRSPMKMRVRVTLKPAKHGMHSGSATANVRIKR